MNSTFCFYSPVWLLRRWENEMKLEFFFLNLLDSPIMVVL
uniref:Uncharacterized protein n=1 Tax=Rhizophora mucronata TaxID=61149 RepID=A0A2P2QZ88_RHIMU